MQNPYFGHLNSPTVGTSKKVVTSQVHKIPKNNDFDLVFFLLSSYGFLLSGKHNLGGLGETQKISFFHLWAHCAMVTIKQSH